MSRINIKDYPTLSGVYLIKDSHGRVIYVGKARNLRQRIRSYLQETGVDQRSFVPFLQRHIHSIDFVVTDNEKEALLLENTLIKKHKPRYNIKLRDDKTYLSLRIDPHAEYPRIEVIRRRQPGDGARYFGPFSSSAALRSTLKFLHKIFSLRMCKDSQFRNRSRPCLMYDVGKCLAPCVREVSKTEYNKIVQGAILFLEGQTDQAIPLLERMMHDYAEQMEFEKAALLRDKIHAIKETIQRQKVSSYREFTLDVIGISREYARLEISVLHYRRGLLEGSRDFGFRSYDQTDPEVLHSFVAQFYGQDKFIPPEILVPCEPEDSVVLEPWLSDLRGGKVSIKVPRRGEKRAILRLAQENAQRKLIAAEKRKSDREELLEKVKKSLNMAYLPRRIECFDISNIMGTLSVGSMVSFFNGEPEKQNYRRFRIRSTDTPNDYAMMKEVLERRYRRSIDENRELPDLILIDGGKGQLNIAIQVLRELGLRGVALAAIAKGHDALARGPTRQLPSALEHDHIYLPNRKNPLTIKPGSAALLFLQRIRDEAHRFAITYHKKLRSKRQLRSELDNVAGVGKHRRNQILNHFGSLENVRKASIEELSSVKGIPGAVAESIFTYFHGSKENG